MKTPTTMPSSKPSRTGQTFESFRDGPNTALAVAAAKAVSERPGAHNPLFIHGAREMGKTHLLRAIHCKMGEYPANDDVVVHAFRCGGSDDICRQLVGTQVLLLDDFHLLNEVQRGPVLELIESMVRVQKQVVIASLASPDEIPWLASSQVELLQSGVVAKLGRPDFETRVALLKSEAQKRHVELSNDAAEFAATQMGLVSTLEVIRICSGLCAKGGVIDMAMARECVADAEKFKDVRPRPNG